MAHATAVSTSKLCINTSGPIPFVLSVAAERRSHRTALQRTVSIWTRHYFGEESALPSLHLVNHQFHLEVDLWLQHATDEATTFGCVQKHTNVFFGVRTPNIKPHSDRADAARVGLCTSFETCN